jgi:kanamycin kinase
VFPDPSSDPVEVPHSVAHLVSGRPHELIWVNGVGGLTFRVIDASGSIYVKWAPSGTGENMASEARRLEWARKHISVPPVLGQGSDADGEWLVTRGIEAQNAVSPRWTSDPRTAAVAVGAGLRSLHDSLPVDDCPFSWGAADRLRTVWEMAERGGLSGHDWSDEFSGMDIDEALDELRSVPREDLVVCHGDPCAPNTLIGDDGTWRSHTDLGRLGVGDRWADLAVASWSTVWNYGPGWENVVYEAYGVEPDEAKIRYYRLLWELG